MKQTALRRAATVAAVAAAFVAGLAGPASAHVTVSPGSATQGGYTKVAFRVPNESDTASTTKLEINLPIDAPVGSVSLKPVAGWTAATEKSKLPTPVKVHDSEITEAVTKITWTAAAGSEIKPGTFQEFDVSLGPLPQRDQMVFKALQTYSDGTIVRWIDEPTTDGTEPESPAPVLKLTTADAAAAASAAAAPPTAPDSTEESGDSGAAWGIAGLIAGLAGLVLGLLAYRKAATAPRP
ncbi:YcnI family protein [Actinoplanes utahensis]|uniref:Membrane protein n=1 Tax=Actinoplanes utahensis TaxID=1869 RepID=A0A0A6UWI9_ACTUT|nr:YcnI family protein [Actinoplanes utahensis]KHD79258.1 membrane protein [Actinoplanes utahensis]GIF30314.1 membrane protein [Actinoplanes utahensis]